MRSGLAALLIPAFIWLPGSVQGQARVGAYITHQDGMEVTRERYRFDGVSLTSEVDIPARGVRLESRTDYTPGLAPARYRVAMRSAAGRTAMQELDVVFSDSVRWALRSPGTSRTGTTAVRRPYATLQNLMFSHLAVILLRYNRRIGGVQVLDVWFPEGSRVGQLRMVLQGDSGMVELAGTSYLVHTDTEGWLRSVTSARGRLTVEWSAAVEFAAHPVPVDTSPPPAVRESTVTVMSGSARLTGVLAYPAGMQRRAPLAVLVPGAGPMDRNGNAPPGIRSNSYAQLAWGLSRTGVATLRYDKRDASGASLAELASDASAVARLLAADPRFGPVVLVGHSEGGWVALRAARTGAPAAGVALLASLGRPYVDGVAEQIARQIDSAAARRFRDVFPRYLAGANPGDSASRLQPLLAPQNRPLARSLAAFDPAAEIRAVRVPVLIVQGAGDVQVSVADAQLLKAARPDASLAILPRADHVFKNIFSRDPVAQLARYLDPTVPLATELVDAIDGWIDGLMRP